MDELVEKLAELEHEQWMEWSKSVARFVPEWKLAKWEHFWVPYNELSEPVKEQDRIWARKALEILSEHVKKENQKLFKDFKENA